MGREREFAALVAAYQGARSGQLQVVVIEGEAGIGKTRLTEELVRWATLEGADVLRGQGDDARARLPYQLLVDAIRPRLAREHAPEDLVADVWLTELVRLFPELHERYPDLPAPMTLAGDEATGQGRLFEAVFQLSLALAERARPEALVLWYDDVQWTDLATRDLLLYRLPRQQEMGSPHLLLLTVRSEALAGTPELESWLGMLARQVPTTRLQLGRAYEWVGEGEQARSTYHALRAHAREAGDATLEGRVLTRLALLTWWDSLDIVVARALAAEALRVLGTTEDRDLLAEAHWAASVLGHMAGDLEVAHTHARRAEELAQATGRRELVAGSLLEQGHSAAQSGDWDESIAALRRGGALYAELAAEQVARLPGRGAGETPQLVALYPWMGPGDATSYLISEAICVTEEGLAAVCRGEPRRGIELGHKAVRLGLDSANAGAEAIGRTMLTTGLVEVGHYEEALQVARPAIERARELGDPTLLLNAVTSWASVQQAILDLEKAELAGAEAAERAEQLGIGHWVVHRSRSLQCATLAIAGDWTGASEAALQSVSLRETLQARVLPLDFARHFEIEALVRGSNHELTASDVRQLGERLRRDGSDRRYRLVYHRLHAVLARGDGAIDRQAGFTLATLRHLVEALELAGEMGLPGEEWQIAAELAAAYRRGGDLTEAEAAVERARAVIARLATGINDQRLRDRFQAAALERAQLLAT